MRHEDIDKNLSNLAFDFFYWFSRFEFSLKENGYLKNHIAGTTAEPGWDEFVKKWENQYPSSPEAEYLLYAPPERQIIGTCAELDWEPVGLQDCKSDLEKVVRLLKTVRNNLFHGGKHGSAGWDDPDRTHKLLNASKSILDQLARLSNLEADYTQYY